MGAKIQKVEKPTAASPLADDVIKQLQARLAEGAFGTGAGPLQQEAGTAIRQFVNSGGVQGDTGGPALEDMIPALEAVHSRDVNRQAADLREGMGIMGTRLGSTMATGEGRFREGANQNWQAQLSNLANAVASNNLARGDQNLRAGQINLGAMGMMHGMGQSNMDPFLAMAQAGILPPEIIASPNPWMQLLSGLVSGGTQVAKASAGIPG